MPQNLTMNMKRRPKNDVMPLLIMSICDASQRICGNDLDTESLVTIKQGEVKWPTVCEKSLFSLYAMFVTKDKGLGVSIIPCRRNAMSL